MTIPELEAKIKELWHNFQESDAVKRLSDKGLRFDLKFDNNIATLKVVLQTTKLPQLTKKAALLE